MSKWQNVLIPDVCLEFFYFNFGSIFSPRFDSDAPNYLNIISKGVNLNTIQYTGGVSTRGWGEYHPGFGGVKTRGVSTRGGNDRLPCRGRASGPLTRRSWVWIPVAGSDHEIHNPDFSEAVLVSNPGSRSRKRLEPSENDVLRSS